MNKIQQEILYREALAMGLDKDDEIVKRRMAQKMQFLAEDVAAAKERVMDCIDCHNRPTHRFGAPYQLLNDAMQKGLIDAEIPEIKAKAMEALSGKYKTQAAALAQIERDLTAYYEKNHADYMAANPDKVQKAVREVKELFSKNMFPDMTVRWDTHPDNIGHLTGPGCFRCHDGEHKTIEGRPITASSATVDAPDRAMTIWLEAISAGRSGK
jgi:hypothetical protein